MLAKGLINAVFNRVLDELMSSNNPVENHKAPVVAKKVTDAVKPVIENATNSEPWFKSRIYRGLIVAVLGFVLGRFGIFITETEATEWLDAFALILEGAGLLYAYYGRAVGSRKPAPKV